MALKIVVWKSPAVLRGLLRRLIGVKKGAAEE